MKRLLLLGFIFIGLIQQSLAQCAMCRATLEANVSNGSEQTLSSTLNFGILYLFTAPYLIIGVIAFLWYRNTRPKTESGQIA